MLIKEKTRKVRVIQAANDLEAGRERKPSEIKGARSLPLRPVVGLRRAESDSSPALPGPFMHSGILAATVRPDISHGVVAVA